MRDTTVTHGADIDPAVSNRSSFCPIRPGPRPNPESPTGSRFGGDPDRVGEARPEDTPWGIRYNGDRPIIVSDTVSEDKKRGQRRPDREYRGTVTR
jgi:hypothetical protein